MTFNLSLLTPDFAICAVDRRLTTWTGKIVTERSNKLTLLDFADGHGFITYTGIGWDRHKRTPSDWIANIPNLGRLSVDDSVAAIQADTEPRLADIARQGVDVRHSFVMGGFKLGIPFALMISNYASLHGPDRSTADAKLAISGLQMNASGGSPHPYLLFSTGAEPRYPARIRRLILPALKRGASSRALRKLVVKTVKDIAYQDDRKATVGSSVQSVVIDRFGNRDVMGHVRGGTTLLEAPNLIGSSASFADICVDVSGNPQWRFDPTIGKAKIAESTCGKCRSPVPEGYRQCGICDSPAPNLVGQR